VARGPPRVPSLDDRGPTHPVSGPRCSGPPVGRRVYEALSGIRYPTTSASNREKITTQHAAWICTNSGDRHLGMPHWPPSWQGQSLRETESLLCRSGVAHGSRWTPDTVFCCSRCPALISCGFEILLLIALKARQGVRWNRAITLTVQEASCPGSYWWNDRCKRPYSVFDVSELIVALRTLSKARLLVRSCA
jgi:hypothetical protein